MRATKSPEKRCRQKLRQKTQDVNPEAALEYFQVVLNKYTYELFTAPPYW